MSSYTRLAAIGLCLLGCTDTSRGRVADAARETVEARDTVEAPDVTSDVDLPTTCRCDHGAECATPCTTPGDVCIRDGYPDEHAVYRCGPPAELGDGCRNQFDEYFHRCAPGLRCLVFDPDEDDTVSLCFDCRPQDFVVSGGCEAALGVFWDGARCASYSGCRCDGDDCGAPFASLEACRRQTERPCSAP